MLAGHLLALGATSIWGSLYIFSRALADSFSPFELSFWRWFIAFVTLYPFVHKRMIAILPALRKHVLRLAVFSLIGMAGFTLMIFTSGRTTSATNMALLAATAPIFIALVSRFALHEPLAGRQLVGLGIAVLGVIVLVTRGDLTHLFSLSLSAGDLWMLCGALCFGTYTILVRFRPAGIPPVEFLTALTGLGALWLVPGVIWQWGVKGAFVLPSASQWLCLIHIGVVTSVIAFSWWNKAIAQIGAVRTGVVYYSLPLFSCLFATIFLGERLSQPQIIGGALILGGIIFSSVRRRT